MNVYEFYALSLVLSLLELLHYLLIYLKFQIGIIAIMLANKLYTPSCRLKLLQIVFGQDVEKTIAIMLNKESILFFKSLGRS